MAHIELVLMASNSPFGSIFNEPDSGQNLFDDAMTGPKKTVPPTKIQAPVLPKILERSRLFEHLETARQSHHKLVWIQGPPGAGKTTFVASYLKARKRKSLWCQLDQGDADPGTWFQVLAMGIQQAVPRYRKTLPQLAPERMLNLPLFAKEFFAELFRRLKVPGMLIFDNYQDVPLSAPLHELLVEATRTLPEHHHIMVISREPPPAIFVALHAEQHILEVAPKALQFTVDETMELLRLHDPIAPLEVSMAHAQQLHAWTGGWVAGMILAGQRDTNDDRIFPTFTEESHTVLFDYLMREGLTKLSPARQMMLLKAAFFPQFTGAMAKQFTEIPNAGRELAQLAHAGYFIEVRGDSPPIYQFHPLFREFLLLRGGEQWAEEERRRLQQGAAAVLAEHGQEEQAIELLFSIGDQQAAILLVLKIAPKLASQFRWQTLETYLQHFPQKLIETTPWLGFWMASTQMFQNPFESEKGFNWAWEQFREQGDAQGEILAWCGIIESIFFSQAHLFRLGPWIDRMADVSAVSSFPSVELEARISGCMFIALLWGGLLADPRIFEWERRILRLLEILPDPSQRMWLGGHVVMFRFWRADIQQAKSILDTLSVQLDQANVSPMARWLFTLQMSVYAWQVGDRALGNTMYQQGVDLARRYRIDKEVDLAHHAAMLAMSLGEEDQATQLHGSGTATCQQADGVPGVQYHYMATALAIDQCKPSEALRHAERTLQLGLQDQHPIGEGVGRIARAQAFIAAKDLQKAHEETTRLLEHGRRYGLGCLEACSWYFAAHIYFLQKNLLEEEKAIKAWLQFFREQGMVYFMGCSRDGLAQSCARALGANIEREHARHIILTLGLTPPADPIVRTTWPWPVSIRTFGNFSIVLANGREVTWKKPPRRPLALLKAVIALGGQHIPASKLIALLWPDAEGDLAYRSLLTAIRRVRTLLGHPDSLQLSGKLVSLNQQLCWVDSLEFDRYVEHATTIRKNESLEHSLPYYEQAALLYHGKFLWQDEQEGWTLHRRNQLESAFQRVIEQLCSDYEQTGRWKDAIDLLDRATHKSSHG